jgi:SAM-dependent methyltransferase
MFFDQPYYIRINEARWAVAERILERMPTMRTCIDVGCGPGWFAERLAGRGLTVLGVEGRPELVAEARRRVPEALFSRVDVCERREMAVLPEVDLVFCFGLLYHLENPMAAIRAIVGLGRHLLIETQVAPHSGVLLQLVAEGRNETQGLNFHAIIPSRDALIHMLYKAGAGSVERFVGTVDHEDFQDTGERAHRREIFVVGSEPLSLPDLVLEPMPPAPKLDLTRKV